MSTSDEQKFTNLVNALNEVLVRQTRLEERLNKLENSSTTAPPAEPVPIIQGVPEPSQELPLIVETPPTPIDKIALPSDKPLLESKVGLTLVNRIGVVTLVVGVAFFFKWAVDNNWIGPAGRVMLGLVAGFITLWVADVLWRKGQQVFAQGITGTGIAIVYLSFYAAFDFYHLIPQIAAFLLLLATTAMAATLAMRYNSPAIVALGFFGAYLIPLLLSNGEDHPWFLIAYLFLINFAATELAQRRRWSTLEVLSFVATTLIFGSWLFAFGTRPPDKFAATIGLLAFCAQRYRTSMPVLFVFTQTLATLGLALIWVSDPDRFFALVLLLLVAIAGLAFARYRAYPSIVPSTFASFWIAFGFSAKGVPDSILIGAAAYLVFMAWIWWRLSFLDEKPSGSDLSVFTLNGIIFYSLCYLNLHVKFHHWLGLLAVAVAASYLVFGMLLYQRKKSFNTDVVLLSLGISVAFLTLAIPIQLEGFSVAIAWSIQAAALSWIGLRFRSNRAIIGSFVVFALAIWHVIAFESLLYPDPSSYSFLFNSRFFVFAVLAAALLLSAYWSAKLERQLALVKFIAGHVVLLGGLSLEVIGWAQRSSSPNGNELSKQTIGITLLFALYAVILVSLGVAKRSAVHRLFGLVLTAVVVVKLYLYDVWQLGRVYQIVAFIILGVLLLSTSFLYSRFKGLIQDWKQDEKATL